jgi:hypothetical protein
VAAVFAVVGLLAPAVAFAQSGWEANRGNCEDVLQNPQNFRLGEVRDCTRAWETYRDVSGLSEAERHSFARGFSRLYYEGDNADVRLARTALERMGMEVLDWGDFLSPDTFTRGTQRGAPIRVEEVSSRNQTRATDANTDGMRAYNRGRYEEAAEQFERALRYNPYHRLAKYNLACQMALLGNHEEALRHLDELSRWDAPWAAEQLSHALTDEDFISMRDNPRFREITGYTRAQVLNGGGDAGVAEVQRIAGELGAEGISVVQAGYDVHDRIRPMVWYRRGYEPAAAAAMRSIGNPNTRTRLLDWDSNFDLIISWGDASALAAVPTPVVQGTLRNTIDTSRDPDEAIEETEAAAEDAAEVIEDPEGAAEDFQEWMPGQ